MRRQQENNLTCHVQGGSPGKGDGFGKDRCLGCRDGFSFASLFSWRIFLLLAYFEAIVFVWTRRNCWILIL